VIQPNAAILVDLDPDFRNQPKRLADRLAVCNARIIGLQ
jgi:hypothetical protein